MVTYLVHASWYTYSVSSCRRSSDFGLLPTAHRPPPSHHLFPAPTVVRSPPDLQDVVCGRGISVDVLAVAQWITSPATTVSLYHLNCTQTTTYLVHMQRRRRAPGCSSASRDPPPPLLPARLKSYLRYTRRARALKAGKKVPWKSMHPDNTASLIPARSEGVFLV